MPIRFTIYYKLMIRLFNKRYRSLTIGETDMLKALFSDSIDYSLVKIYKDKFLPYLEKVLGDF